MRLNDPRALAVFRAVERAFGEPVRVEPQVENQHTGKKPDPDRAAIATRATLAISPSVVPFDGNPIGTRINTGSRVVTQDVSAFFRPETYAALGYDLMPGDRVFAIERDAAFTVTRDPVSSDRGDIVVYLVHDR